MRKHIASALMLALSLSTVSAQIPPGAPLRLDDPIIQAQLAADATIIATNLTETERARVATHGDWLHFLDSNCQAIERKISGGQEIVRFRCQNQRAIERVIVFNGDIEQEPYGFAAFKAHLKNGAMYLVGGAIFILILYGKAKS